MGELLMKYYQYIGEEKGIEGRKNLARLTQIPSITAATKDDSTENIEKFKKAVAELTGKPAPNL